MRCEKAMNPRAGTLDVIQATGRGAIRRGPNLPRYGDTPGLASASVGYGASRRA